MKNRAKSPRLYIVIVIISMALIAAAVYTSLDDIRSSNAVVTVLRSVSLGCIILFWINAVKELMYTVWYNLFMRRKPAPLVPTGLNQESPRVLMLYPTCNDFDRESAYQCMNQDYDNFTFVVLNDSDVKKRPDQVKMIAEFCDEFGIDNIQREDRIGFKAGNINNFLQNSDLTGKWDYAIILDADERLPHRSKRPIQRFLDYFAAKPMVGIVQANHISTRNRNPYMKTFAPGVNSFWTVYQSVKQKYGFMSLLGHGAMISRECYEAIGGFRDVVAEDITCSLDASENGYSTEYAPDIMCEEEFPVNYLAFAKRHAKWSQGNIGFVLGRTLPILRSKHLRWFEKLDVLLFTYSMPLTFALLAYLVIGVLVLAPMNAQLHLPAWMLIPTITFFFAPMLNDVLFYAGKMKVSVMVHYLISSTLMYGSTFMLSVIASIKAMFGGGVFVVTPKDDEKITFFQAIRMTRYTWLFGIGFSIVAIITTKSALPAIFLAVPAIFGMYMAVSHHQPKHKKEKVVNEISSVREIEESVV